MSVFGCFQKFYKSDRSKNLSIGCLSVTGITHPSVQRKGGQGLGEKEFILLYYSMVYFKTSRYLLENNFKKHYL